MKSTADLPLIRLSQNCSFPMPFGAITPSPVMTTRRRLMLRQRSRKVASLQLLPFHSRQPSQFVSQRPYGSKSRHLRPSSDAKRCYNKGIKLDMSRHSLSRREFLTVALALAVAPGRLLAAEPGVRRGPYAVDIGLLYSMLS